MTGWFTRPVPLGDRERGRLQGVGEFAQHRCGVTAGRREVHDLASRCDEFARDVGANVWQIFLLIILPLMTRAVLIVFCLNVIGVFGSFTLPYLIGPAQPMMMGVSMQQTFNGYKDRIGALTQAVITFIFCASVGVVYVRTVSRPR